MKCYWFKVPFKKGKKKEREREILHRVREKYCRKGEGGRREKASKKKKELLQNIVSKKHLMSLS